MKELQNHFTTPEQSKRLLELGVPADSADMLWDGTYDLVNGWEFEDYPTFSNKHYSYHQSLYREEDAINILPCWSDGRLLSLIKVCTGTYPDIKDLELPMVEFFIDFITACIKINIFDFSKLED